MCSIFDTFYLKRHRWIKMSRVWFFLKLRNNEVEVWFFTPTPDLNICFLLKNFEASFGQICAANLATEFSERAIDELVVGPKEISNEGKTCWWLVGLNRWMDRLLKEWRDQWRAVCSTNMQISFMYRQKHVISVFYLIFFIGFGLGGIDSDCRQMSS